MSDDGKTTVQGPASHAATTGRTPSNAPASKAPGNKNETDKEVLQANDYSLGGETKSYQEVTNPNLHYGAREFVDPVTGEAAEADENSPQSADSGAETANGPDAQGVNRSDEPGPTSNPPASANQHSPADSAGVDDPGSRNVQNNGHRAVATADTSRVASADAAQNTTIDATLGAPASSGPDDGSTGGGGGPVTNPNTDTGILTVVGGSVDENATGGTAVATLDVKDAGPGEVFTYQIVGGSSLFEIVGDQIVVRAGADIDYEDVASHALTISVTDSDGNIRTEPVMVTVNDLIDETPTDITLTGGSVDENAAAGTTVATLSTIDADAGDSHTYAITSDPSGFFEIVGNEVRVAAGATIDFESDQTHAITVEVTDAGGNTYSEVITLAVNDLIDENPTDITLTGGLVDENAAQGTVVTTLFAIDADAGDSHSYAITSDPSGFFEIVGNEVRVAAGASIDFETDQTHDITVEVTDAGGNTYSEVITLTVNDLNESATDITLVGGSVDESAAAGTIVATLSTVDADAGDSHTYAITSDPSGFFEIVGNEVRVAAGASIDFETDQNHDITLEVTDAGGNTYSEVITLTVNDLIDETPTDITLTGGSVDENSTAGTTVATLSTVDADAGDSHTYAITSDPSGFFEIVGNEVRVAAGASIDFEANQTHDITVETSDAAGNTYSEVITIAVNDLIDENPTDITVGGGSVDENSTAGTTVATLSTVDADAGDSHTYAITSDPSGFFEIVGSEVRVATGAAIDFETDQSHDITLEVTDAGGNTYSEAITLTVNDLIDENPTDITLTGGLVDENSTAGTTVATLSTVDADAGDSHTYAITSDPSGFFEIVGNEVRVAAGAAIDFETDQTHDITVETTDAAGNTYSEVITLSVNDLIDENPTDITLTGGSVDENATAGTTVATLSTVDADAGDSHTYAITSDPSGFFEIVGNEVRVAAGANIDFETDQNHDITVETTDAAGTTYSEVITLTVNDLIDENPTDITVGGGSVDENAAAGTTVATLSTVDADAGDSHTYSITNDPSGFFEIVGNEVRVAAGASIDFETDQTHDITVEVTDAGGNTYSEVITLTVNDLNESATDITLVGGSVDESAAAGTIVATLSTVDADAGDSHSYAITSDPSGFFEIVGNEVRVAAGASIDFETDQTHDITVETTDSAGNTYSEIITLTVNDLIDETPTDITLTGGSVDENAAAGTTVATLSTVDADAGDSHTYAITSDPSGFFEIVGNEVRVAAGADIDFEANQTHDITVEVTDAGGNTYSEAITLTVNDLIDENPTDITLTGGSVDENAAAGTTVATLSTVDADAGDSHAYAITSDPSGFFEIVGNEVRVAAGANIDFETDQNHDITVETTDAAGNTYSEVITLTVNDLIDENPTDITVGGGAVDENSTAGTTVATLSTVDADAGDSHSYAITSDPSGFFEIVGNEVRVAAGASIDFETDQTHDITVEVTDAGGNTYSEVITLTVNDLNESATDITLVGGSVDESAAAGTIVATLSTVDADAGDSHTYAITSDPSGLLRDCRQRGCALQRAPIHRL